MRCAARAAPCVPDSSETDGRRSGGIGRRKPGSEAARFQACHFPERLVIVTPHQQCRGGLLSLLSDNTTRQSGDGHFQEENALDLHVTS